jgi:two-component system CheB/CheR fusion protein
MPARKTSSKSHFALEPATPAPNVSPRFPVVGIGASAGGLEAITSLVKELASHLGMAYVVVLHLDPARESKVSEILARTTPIPVLQAKDGMHVEPDHIYVIPPNYDMTIDHWVLHLRDRELHRSANTTIDTFLRSLAVAHGSDAIGVILSGTASDGTLGLAAVKGEAGERNCLWLCRLHSDSRRNR